jgi:ribose transport system ATP-binding protein
MSTDVPVLDLQHITKKYPGVTALDDVSLEVRRGEVHALVGENGAGKSTLVKTCTGAITPDKGKIVIDTKEYLSLTPKQAEKSGIAIIYQEFNLVNELSVAENVFLGRAIRKGIIINKNAMENATAEIFNQMNFSMDTQELVKNLSVGYQQIVEIAKALSTKAKLIIMDEPSAPLTNTEVEHLFSVIRKLKASGVTIIYISHRLEEIFQIADRVTVMRDGKIIETLSTAGTTMQQLIALMVGRELKETFPPRPECVKDKILLDVEKLSGNGVENISFCVKSGEVLGFAGLIGAGRTEIVELIFGAKKRDSGIIKRNGKEITCRLPESAIRHGISLVPEDRKRQGVLIDLSVKENVSVAILKRLSRFFIINRKKEDAITLKYYDELNIKTPSINQLVKYLSGGNQQKVVLAKWLASNAELIIFDEPTRGIDVGAKYEIYKLINDIVLQGKGVIMISSEMEELIGMSDRIIVMAEGSAVAELSKADFNQETILQYASKTKGNLHETKNG